MDKLTMAHEHAMGLLAGAKTQLTTIEELVRQSWVYADLMQAESKKRQEGVPEAILGAERNG